MGFILLSLCIVANLLIRSRLPHKQDTRLAELLPDFRIFVDGTGALAMTTAAVFFVEWGLFVPLTYLPSYAVANGIDDNFSYQLIAIFNAGSVFGRWLPGYIADRIGRFNTMIVTVFMCLASTFAFWLPAGNSIGLIVTYCVIFGFASGSNISLTPICVGQLCDTSVYGRYYATSYTVVSFGTLTGIPIGGALISAAGGKYWSIIVFTGCSYVASLSCLVYVRIRKAGWSLRTKW